MKETNRKTTVLKMQHRNVGSEGKLSFPIMYTCKYFFVEGPREAQKLNRSRDL